MALTLRLEKDSALTYRELDDNFIYLQGQITDINNSIFRVNPLIVAPCNTNVFDPFNPANLATPSGISYAYYAKQACTSSFPWWTGSNGKGILASETYNTLDAGNGYIGSLAFGQNNTIGGINAFAHGISSSATGTGAHAEGSGTFAGTAYSHTEGLSTNAQDTGSYSHAEGYSTTVHHQYSHAEGENTHTYARSSHAEGYQTQTGYAGIISTSDEGKGSHSEGRDTVASGSYSHVEGWWSVTRGWASHAEGLRTLSSGHASHTEGAYTTASFSASHAEGWGTSTGADYQNVTGRWNTLNNTDDYFVIGDGTSAVSRSNAFGINATRMYASNSIYFPDLISGNYSNILVFNSASGQVFYTSSNAIAGGSALTIKDEGTTLSSAATSINFAGSGVTATNVGSAITVTIPGTVSLPIKDEGTTLTASPTSINFTGYGVTATSTANSVTVDIPGRPLLGVYDEGNTVTLTPTSFNFTGPGVTTTAVGTNVTVNVPTSSITVYDENTVRTTNLSTLKFTGTGVNATQVGSTTVVDIPGETVLPILDEGNILTTTPATINFVGAGVDATLGLNNNITVTIPGVSPTVPGSPDMGVQYNNNGTFAADTRFFYDYNFQELYVPGLNIELNFSRAFYDFNGSAGTTYNLVNNGESVVISKPTNVHPILNIDISSINNPGTIITIKHYTTSDLYTTSIVGSIPIDIDNQSRIDLTRSYSSVTLICLGQSMFSVISSHNL